MKNKFILIGSIVFVVIVITILCIFLLKSSSVLELSDFEKIAVYGYLEDYLSLDKLYLLSNKSSYDESQYLQSKVKQILDSHYEKSHDELIPTSIISDELSKNYGISADSLDYHGILVSDFEFSPQDNAFIRVEGANSGVSSIENQVFMNENSDNKLSIQKIEKASKDSYIVYFNVMDSSESNVSASGSVTINVVDNAYELENCTITSEN